jgi:membrane fusion protein
MDQEVNRQPALFRQSAVDFHRQQRLWGDIALVQPTSTKFTIWFLIAVVAVAVVFLLQAPYARKETVPGYLTPSAGTARVLPPQPGTVGAVEVAEGQMVQVDQPLFSISTAQVSADGQDVNSSMLDNLTRQKERVLTQIQAEEQRTMAERRRVQSSIAGLAAEVAQIQNQITTQEERIKLAQRAVDSGALLREQGFVSQTENDTRRAALLEQQQNRGQLTQQLSARRTQLSDQRHALEQVPMAQSDRVRLLKDELSEIEQKIAQAQGRRAYVIRSPVAGRVSGLQTRVGQPADPKVLLATIVPDKGKLQAVLFVPTRAIGFIQPGQRVRLLYDAFPFQNFGTYGGKVVLVSQSVVTAADAAGPIPLKEAAYRITVDLDQPFVESKGQRTQLQPDMQLRADIIIDRRRLMDWIVDPLVGTGLRELQN